MRAECTSLDYEVPMFEEVQSPFGSAGKTGSSSGNGFCISCSSHG